MGDPRYIEWHRTESRTLARCVRPAALPTQLRWPRDANRRDVATSSGILGLVELLYKQLLQQGFHYDIAPANGFSDTIQLIRKGSTIVAEGQATCLDLSLVFAAMCLDSGLCPILVLLQGHALVGVSVRRTVGSLHPLPKPMAWQVGCLDQLDILKELVDHEYLLIECTGAATSHSLQFGERAGRTAGAGRHAELRAGLLGYADRCWITPLTTINCAAPVSVSSCARWTSLLCRQNTVLGRWLNRTLHLSSWCPYRRHHCQVPAARRH